MNSFVRMINNAMWNLAPGFGGIKPATWWDRFTIFHGIVGQDGKVIPANTHSKLLKAVAMTPYCALDRKHCAYPNVSCLTVIGDMWLTQTGAKNVKYNSYLNFSRKITKNLTSKITKNRVIAESVVSCIDRMNADLTALVPAFRSNLHNGPKDGGLTLVYMHYLAFRERYLNVLSEIYIKRAGDYSYMMLWWFLTAIFILFLLVAVPVYHYVVPSFVRAVVYDATMFVPRLVYRTATYVPRLVYRTATSVPQLLRRRQIAPLVTSGLRTKVPNAPVVPALHTNLTQAPVQVSLTRPNNSVAASIVVPRKKRTTGSQLTKAPRHLQEKRPVKTPVAKARAATKASIFKQRPANGIQRRARSKRR